MSTIEHQHHIKNYRFGNDEYQARLAKCRHAMYQAGIDVMIISDPSNMAWLTGYDGWSFYVHQCVILAMSGDPIWFGRQQDANGAKRTVFMHNEANIIGYPDYYVQNPAQHPMDYLSRLLHEWGWANFRFGVELDNYWYTAKSHQALTAGCPKATFIDQTGLVNWQRAVKSAREIEYMKIAGDIVAKTHREIFERIEPGLPKNQLVADIYHSLISGINTGDKKYGGDYPAIVPLLPSGPDASAPHLTWNDEPLKANEATFFEIAGCYERYHCPISRTIYLGEPPDALKRAEAAVIECIDAAMTLAKPGNTAEMVANAALRVLHNHGFDKTSRFGYPIGISYPPDWGERTYSIRAYDKTPLQPGMTFHFIPALWQDDWGLEITESIVITETGCECLAPMPDRVLLSK